MKKIHLIRHAKSSWKDTSLKDIKRPLNKRGIKSCEIMARRIFDAGCRFELVCSSSATRAMATIELISHHLACLKINYQLDESLYTFDFEELLDWCRRLDDMLDDVVIVGHNPALTSFCNWLSGSELNNIPTCGYVQLQVAVNSWEELTENSAEMSAFIKPKD